MTDFLNPFILLSPSTHYYLASRQPVSGHALPTGLSEPWSLWNKSCHWVAQPLHRRTGLHPPVPSFAMGQHLLLELSPSLFESLFPTVFRSANCSGWNSGGQVSTSSGFSAFSGFFFFPSIKEAVWCKHTGDTGSAEGKRVCSRSLGRSDRYRVYNQSSRWRVVRARLEADEKQGWEMGVIWHGAEHYSANQTWGLQRGGPGLPG